MGMRRSTGQDHCACVGTGQPPGEAAVEVLPEVRPQEGPRAELPGQGLHLPKDSLWHVAREGRQHRGHPQRAHPLHDPVLGERRREGAEGEKPPPSCEGTPGAATARSRAGGSPRLPGGSLGQEDQEVTWVCPGASGAGRVTCR